MESGEAPAKPRVGSGMLGDLEWCISCLLESFFFFPLSLPLRFKRGFESEPTLHSGINYAVLLLAAGHQFDTSFELRKVGEWTPDGIFLCLRPKYAAFSLSLLSHYWLINLCSVFDDSSFPSMRRFKLVYKREACIHTWKWVLLFWKDKETFITCL